MANVFLNGADRDIETAIMLEQAIVHNIGNAVAYTDGDRIFINTEDNLYNILPAYDHRMLKWLLWHERYHKELRHHNRFFKYIESLKEEDLMDEFHVTKEEVNIIMDILVHDSLSKLFPELVDIALLNLAQMRNRNSLGYTFTTHTLEEMLDEYKAHKHPDKDGEGKDEDSKDGDSKDEDGKDGDSKSEQDEGDDSDKKAKDSKGKSKKKEHSEGGKGTPDKSKDRPEDGEPKETETPSAPPEHDKTDWSKLEKIDSKEFIDKEESDAYMRQITRLRQMKARLGKLTETLNGLVTSTRRRTYTMPSYIQSHDIIFKGSKPGKTALYLCFDASGSMGSEMETFKEIISKSIPQALNTPTEWFSGYSPRNIEDKCENKEGRNPRDYFKGQFKDFMETYASAGYDDDGDRTIELCYLAEQKGYTPIGITDGGGQISWSKPMLQKLQRTIFVGPNDRWLDRVKEINPRIQTLYV